MFLHVCVGLDWWPSCGLASIADAATSDSYTRVLTTVQREDGTSLDNKIDACRAHAESIAQALVVSVLADDWLGTTLDRPRVDEAHQLAREGAIGVHICCSTDGLGRDPIQVPFLRSTPASATVASSAPTISPATTSTSCSRCPSHAEPRMFARFPCVPSEVRYRGKGLRVGLYVER